MTVLNNNQLDFSLNSLLEQAIIDVQSLLRVFTSDIEFDSKIKLAFGNGVDLGKAKVLIGELAKVNSSSLPKIEIRSESEINGAFGAFARANNTIYLSREFLAEKANDIPSITAVLSEELGHFIDSQLKATDTPGDEGELFSNLLGGVVLSDGELQRIKAEDDSAIITIDGNLTLIEMASSSAISQGSVISQGDEVMRSDIARNLFGVDGTGIKIGVISDSFNVLGGANSDFLSGDLPSGKVTVLTEGFLGSRMDEGRAMMQLIHDVAPGASLMFHSVFDANGNATDATMQKAIIDLFNAGAKIIVDDFGILDEPMFQDGLAAQAVDSVVAKGVSYFSAAANGGRKSYESEFNPAISGFDFFGNPIYVRFGLSGRVGIAHDFDPGPGIDIFQSISIPANTTAFIPFQWDSPWGNSRNDLDIYITDK